MKNISRDIMTEICHLEICIPEEPGIFLVYFSEKRIIHMVPYENINFLDFIDLTRREKEVLQLLLRGSSYRVIADQLFITLDTVRSHIKNIYRKLNINSRHEVALSIFKQYDKTNLMI